MKLPRLISVDDHVVEPALLRCLIAPSRRGCWDEASPILPLGPG